MWDGAVIHAQTLPNGGCEVTSRVRRRSAARQALVPPGTAIGCGVLPNWESDRRGVE